MSQSEVKNPFLRNSFGRCVDEFQPPCSCNSNCSGFPCEMNCTRNTDNEMANNDGGNGHPLGIPPKQPGSFHISIVVVQIYDREDENHDVDGVHGTKNDAMVSHR